MYKNVYNSINHGSKKVQRTPGASGGLSGLNICLRPRSWAHGPRSELGVPAYVHSLSNKQNLLKNSTSNSNVLQLTNDQMKWGYAVYPTERYLGSSATTGKLTSVEERAECRRRAQTQLTS